MVPSSFPCSLFNSSTLLTALPLCGLSHPTASSFHTHWFSVSWGGHGACLVCCTARDVLSHGALGRAGTSCFSEMERLPETLGGLEMRREFKMTQPLRRSQINSWNPCGGKGTHSETLQRGWLWVNFMTPNLFGKVDKSHSMKSLEVVYPRGLTGTQDWNG